MAEPKPNPPEVPSSSATRDARSRCRDTLRILAQASERAEQTRVACRHPARPDGVRRPAPGPTDVVSSSALLRLGDARRAPDEPTPMATLLSHWRAEGDGGSG